MVTLRSREILPITKPKSVPDRPTPEPVTPAKVAEPLNQQSPQSASDSTTRRSSRLASLNGLGKRTRNTQEQNAAVQVCDSDSLSLRSGKSVAKRKVEYNNNSSGVSVKEMDNVITIDKNEDVEDNASGQQSEVIAKGKGKLVEENDGSGVSEDSDSIKEETKFRRFSKEEKGKEKIENDVLVSVQDSLNLELKAKVKELVDGLDDNVPVPLENARLTRNRGRSQNREDNTKKFESRMDQFRDIARKNASRFAQFDREEEVLEEERLPSDVNIEVPIVEEYENVEDWPGPFSTAMKIIRDRANNLNSQQGASVREKAESVSINWVPRRNDQGLKHSRMRIPSLQELCMRIIVKNVDAVASLEHVPDSLRHRLCQLLCDSRKMSSSFLDLIVHGSPTEIRIKDCSWMTEEDFVKCFQDCDTSNLTVLQLDKCGRCMPDYVLPATLARSSKCLPALITLSLSGACRLSDTGLRSLVSSAIALRSINLSQCSLLTSASIGTLADSLASVLQELYINDCQSLDAMLILPALKKFERLEVLSVSGIQTVCDDFVRQFVAACGHNIRELCLADCVRLTDSSLKVIAENCPRLYALDLVNLQKLTDSSLGYLANGCREIQKLKLCRNAFSDEGIAAFLESSGEHLKELSLNNVKKVGHNTAISIARRSSNLISLDLSWCRNLTDEAVGLIVDSCSSLRVLKLFGCGQITNVFLQGHSNPEVKIIGLKMSPVLEHMWAPDSQDFPLRYSWVHAV